MIDILAVIGGLTLVGLVGYALVVYGIGIVEVFSDVSMLKGHISSLHSKINYIEEQLRYQVVHVRHLEPYNEALARIRTRLEGLEEQSRGKRGKR